MKKTPAITVTGACGFIGSNLCGYLAQELNTSISTYDTSFRHNIFNDDFEKHVQEHDIIIHLAAKTSVEGSFKSPDEHFYNNTLGTARVVQLCAKYGKRLIYPSTAAVYHKELSPYAKSKAMAEDIVKSMMPKVKTTILRFYNVYGPYMNPNSGSIMYNFQTAKNLVVFGDGEQTRDFVSVKDVCGIIKDIIKHPKRWEDQIVDVGTGEAYSINYVAGLFSYFRNLPIIYKPLRREIKWSIADPSHLKKLYKKKLITDLEKEIKELV